MALGWLSRLAAADFLEGLACAKPAYHPVHGTRAPASVPRLPRLPIARASSGRSRGDSAQTVMAGSERSEPTQGAVSWFDMLTFPWLCFPRCAGLKLVGTPERRTGKNPDQNATLVLEYRFRWENLRASCKWDDRLTCPHSHPRS